MKIDTEKLLKARYSSPLFDTGFQILLGTEKQKDCLIHFLNAILKLDNRNKIIDIDYHNRHLVPEEVDGKQGIVDIFVTDNSNNKYIVEMQIAQQSYFFQRALFYTSRAYTTQFEKGGKYKDLTKVVFIGILKENAIKDSKRYFSHYQLINRENDHKIDYLEFYFIELEKFNPFIGMHSTLAEKWINMLKSAHTYKDVPKYLDEEIYKKALHALDLTKWEDTEMKSYSYELQKEQERLDSIEFAAEKAAEKALQEGLEKGKIEIISNMLQAGMDVANIAKFTKISENDIKKLIS